MRFLLLLLTILTICTPGNAQENFDYGTFSQLPVLDKGRVKPLGAYARLHLETLSEKQNLKGQNANQWLAQTLFDPARALENPVFRIRSVALKTRLELQQDKQYFSLNDLHPGINKTAKDVFELVKAEQNTLTPEQKALLSLHEHVIAATKLMRSFSMLLPLNIEIPARYRDKINADMPLTYMALRPLEQRIENDLQTIIKRKAQNPDAYTTEEKAIALLGFQLQQIHQGGTGNAEFRIIPLESNNWASPWELLNTPGHARPKSMARPRKRLS